MKKGLVLFMVFTLCFFYKAQKITESFILTEKTPTLILPEKLKENSGLEYVAGFLWTFNDSGGKPELYKVDPNTGEIIQTVEIENAKNVDWEDLTSDGKRLYIADTGNNKGNRKNLRIYQIKIKDLGKASKVKVKAKAIKFHYPEQKDFSKKESGVTNFDAEAMIFKEGKLYLFTKERSTNCTSQYEIKLDFDKKQPAKLIEIFDVESAVTAADSKGDELLFTGYTADSLVINWVISNFSKRDRTRTFKKNALGFSSQVGQIEGITYGEDKIYISSEKFKKKGFQVDQKLYVVRQEALLE